MPSALPQAAGRSYAVGVAWSALNAVAGVALPFAMFIVFARLLSPGAIGVVVLATSMAEILKACGAPGLYEALLQQPANERRMHQAACAALLLAGAALLAAHVGLVAILGLWMPDVGAHRVLLSLIGLRIAFDLASLQPQAALAQRHAFGRMAVRAIVGNAGAGALGAALALCGAPLAGLVAYLIAQSALVFATTAIGAGGLARPVPHLDCLRAMAREAAAATVVRLVAAVNNSLDQVIVAAAIGSARLGWYNLGKRLETTIITTAAAFATNLFQPRFAGADPAARAEDLARGLAVLAVLCGAPCAWFVVNATSIVGAVLGPAWAPAAAVAALLALAGLLRALGSVHGALLSVSGRNRKLMRLTSVSAAAGIAAVLAGAPLGITAVAALLVFRNLLVLGWMAVLTLSDAGRPVALHARAAAGPFLVLLASTGAVRAAGAMLHAPPLGTIAASGVVVALAGLACLHRAVPLAALLPRRRLSALGTA